MNVRVIDDKAEVLNAVININNIGEGATIPSIKGQSNHLRNLHNCTIEGCLGALRAQRKIEERPDGHWIVIQEIDKKKVFDAVKAINEKGQGATVPLIKEKVDYLSKKHDYIIKGCLDALRAQKEIEERQDGYWVI